MIISNKSKIKIYSFAVGVTCTAEGDRRSIQGRVDLKKKNEKLVRVIAAGVRFTGTDLNLRFDRCKI